MAGNTSAINFATLRVQWDSHSSMAAICSYWSISKDQLVRLRDVLPLPKRHDRALRFKPKRAGRVDPTEDEIWNKIVFQIQATWDEQTELARRVTKPVSFRAPIVETTEQTRDFLDDVNRDFEW